MEPFNEDRYKALMDGLKAKEVNFDEVINSNSYFRLEAEYFSATQFLYSGMSSGEDVVLELQYGTSDALNEEGHGYPVLRLNEFDGMFIKKPAKYCDSLSEFEFNALQLKKGDVLICRTNGNPNLVGRAALVMENSPFAFASYLFRIRTNKNIYPETLVTYLNCNYGRMEIDKNSMKGNQTNFSPAKFRDIKIPPFKFKFQEKIRELFSFAYEIKIEATRLYLEAEKTLLNELGIKKIPPISLNVSVKSLSVSLLKFGRLDAEYYHHRYEEITRLFDNPRPLGEVCFLHDEDHNPVSKEEYRYIELSNVGAEGNVFGVEIIRGDELPTRARRLVKKGQVIISSIEGSLQSCALITSKYNLTLCSTGFFVIDSAEINSETLLVLFKSEPMQALLKQRCSGTILTAITKDEFLKLPIPNIGQEKQNDIRRLVQNSFYLREQAEELLESLKRAIEIAIEQNEEIAINFLAETEGRLK